MGPRISAIVLAAGLSSRMAPLNKLLVEIDGVPLVRRTLDAVLADGPRETIVVTGHMADDVARAVQGLPVRLVHNPDYREGMGASLACGVRAVSPDCQAVLVHLGDMPSVSPATIARLVSVFEEGEAPVICAPVHRGERGHPVLFDRAFIAALANISGDVGARAILQDNVDSVRLVDVDDPGILLDMDGSDNPGVSIGQA